MHVDDGSVNLNCVVEAEKRDSLTDIENNKKGNILSIQDAHIEKQLDHNDVANASLINDKLVLEPDATGKIILNKC